MRDLTDSSSATIAAERARIPREGVGAEILAHQGLDGPWHRAGEPDWLPTLFTMLLLRATGVDRTQPAVASAVARLEAGSSGTRSSVTSPSNLSLKARSNHASTVALSR